MFETYLYANFLISVFGETARQTDLLSDTIKVSLHNTGSNVSNLGSLVSWDDADGEITDSGYTSGGTTLTSKTLTFDSTWLTTTFECARANWAPPSVFAAPAFGVIYNATAANKPVIGVYFFQSEITNASVLVDDRQFVIGTQSRKLSFAFQPIAQSNVRWYPRALGNALGGYSSGQSRMTDWVSDTIKVSLHGSGYTPSVDDQVFGDVTDELSGGGYPDGGLELPGRSITYYSAPAIMIGLAATNPLTFTALTQPDIQTAVIYNDSGTDKPLLGFIDLLGVGCDSQDFVIDWNTYPGGAAGLLNMRNPGNDY